MRRSERIAVVAVVCMAAPAFLTFPALGGWYVWTVWGDLDGVSRAVFLSSVATLCITIPAVFRRHLDLFFYGTTREFGLFDQWLILGPAVVGVWALTQSWGVPIVVVVVSGLRWIQEAVDADDGRTARPEPPPRDAVDTGERRSWRWTLRRHGKVGGGVAYTARPSQRRSPKHGLRRR